jgi:hypothetical protein
MGSRLASSRVAKLPNQFPIGTRYVIEGHGGGSGRLRISLRRLEFPDGQYLDLPIDKTERGTARRRPLARRNRARK